MKLYLVRHAVTTWNEENRIQGSKNPSLSAAGLRQARHLARRFKKEKISLIYASDRLRARKTAQVIQQSLNVPLLYEKGLREIHLGLWEGKTPEEVNKRYQDGYRKWLHAPSSVRIPGAEPVREFRKRVLQAFEGVVQRPAPDGNILVVTHGGVIATFLSSLLKGSEDYFLLRLRLDNAGVSVVRVKEGRATAVCCINDTSHLGRLL